VGVLEDCAEFVNLMSAGKMLFRHGSAADKIADGLVDLIGNTAVRAGTTALFVSKTDAMDVNQERLRNYVHGELDKGLHITVTVFDPEQLTLVEDQALLEQTRDLLGVDVNLPGGEALTSKQTTDQREALRNLIADPSAPSQEKLTTYLADRPPGLTDASGWMADHSGLLGVPLSLFGNENFNLSALDSSAPVTRRGLEKALNGTFGRVGLPQVVDEINKGRLDAALVHGWSPGAANPDMRWLIRGKDGTARWAVNGPDGTLPEFTKFGADDARTRLLEQPDTTVLLLGQDGIAYTPQPAPPPVAAGQDLHLSVSTRTSGRSALIGEWDIQSPIQRELLEQAERFDGDSILVNVRRGPSVRGLTTLEPPQSRALNSILKNNTEIPLVLATESNDQLRWMTTQLHQRSAIQPVADGFEKLYEVMGPGAQRDRYGALTDEVMFRGASLAQTAPDSVMPEVRKLVASNSWAEAAQFFRDNIESVRTEEAAEQTVEMVRQYDKHLLDRDQMLGGTIGSSPLFAPDVSLPAYRTLVTTAVRAANDPTLAGKASIEPVNGWITEAIARHSQTVDENFLFSYLTNRPVPLEGAAGEYMMGLIWLREMVQAMLSGATKLAPVDGLAVMKAKGELDGERAARSVRAPEILRAHAVIAENLIGTLFPDQGMGTVADRQKLLEALDCLTGEARVAWLYIYKNQVKPYFPQHDQALNTQINYIVTCH